MFISEISIIIIVIIIIILICQKLGWSRPVQQKVKLPSPNTQHILLAKIKKIKTLRGNTQFSSYSNRPLFKPFNCIVMTC